MTHLEGFLLEGGRVRFTDATLRPAGARIGPMLAFAYDIDPYRVWARVAVDGCFDGPWERKYAVGTVFLRGVGQGQVERVEGLEEVRRRVGDELVDSRVPRIGRSKSHTYTGDGYITVRHPETEMVESLPGAHSEHGADHVQSRRSPVGRRRWLAAAMVAADGGFQSAALPAGLG